MSSFEQKNKTYLLTISRAVSTHCIRFNILLEDHFIDITFKNYNDLYYVCIFMNKINSKLNEWVAYKEKVVLLVGSAGHVIIVIIIYSKIKEF